MNQWMWEALAFFAGCCVQAAGYGYFFGNLKREVMNLSARLERIEREFVLQPRALAQKAGR